MAPAVRAAAHEVREQLLRLASDMFEIAAGDLSSRRADPLGRRHPAGAADRGDRQAGQRLVRGGGSRGPNPSGIAVNTFGCQIAQVAVDTVTGMVTSSGWWPSTTWAGSQPAGRPSQVRAGSCRASASPSPRNGWSIPPPARRQPGLDDYKVPTIADLPRWSASSSTCPIRACRPACAGWVSRRSCPRPAPSETPWPRRWRAPARGALHPAQGARGAGRMRRSPTSGRRRSTRPRSAADRLGAADGRRHRPADAAPPWHPAGRLGGRPSRLGPGRDRAPRRWPGDRRHRPGRRPGRRRGGGRRYAALASAAAAASPQLREMGTVGGNLCQQRRCWYYRHPDLQCWLRGGDTCYAQIGDHRKHGLEPGDCISVAPSDLSAALLALGARSRPSEPARRASRSPSCTGGPARTTARRWRSAPASS